MKKRAEITAIRSPMAISDRLGIRHAAILILLGLGSATSQAQEAAENRGTADQRMACTGDAFRLCGSEIPIVSRIIDCLERNRPQLSPACRVVFSQDSARLSSSKRFRRHHRHDQNSRVD
jgi:hypothetical protein